LEGAFVRNLALTFFLVGAAGCADEPVIQFPDAGVMVQDMAPVKSGTVIATAQTLTACLASDANALYWADQGGTQNRILKVGKAGGTPTALASGGDDRTCVVVDDTNAYYVDGDNIMKVPLAGGSASAVLMGQHVLKSLIAVQGGFVYWVTDVYGNVDAFNGKNALVRVPVGGGTIETLYAQVNGNPGGLRVDANTIYYSDLDGMFGRPKSGGTAVTYGMSTIHSNSFALDAMHLVMDEVNDVGSGDVAVMRLDGMSRVVVSMQQASTLAIDGSGVYGRQNNHLVYFSLDGQSTLTLAAEAPRAIALDATTIYFTDGSSILKAGKPGM
jgi:hypothetical protein